MFHPEYVLIRHTERIQLILYSIVHLYANEMLTVELIYILKLVWAKNETFNRENSIKAKVPTNFINSSFAKRLY